MNIKQWLQADYLPIPLIALMALTRFHHFGDVLHLPDASLAVFFFAGFYRNKAFFAFLLVLAGLIDAIAIANGTSSWCVSPAYAFLIPTYAVMWFAGRYCAAFKSLKIAELGKQFGAMVLASSMAFVVSNGSFYLLSGRYPDLSWGQYFARITMYYPPYVSATLLYMVLGYGVIKLAQILPVLAVKHEKI